jgi:beta-galactosidase
VPSDAASDVLALKLRCVDEKGEDIIDRVVRLDLQNSDRTGWVATLPATAPETVSEDAAEVRIASERWALAVARSTGELTIRDRNGRVIVAGIFPHSGRKPTEAEALGAKNTGLWTMSTLAKAEAPAVQVERKDGQLSLSVSGRYPRPDAPEQAFVGGYRIEPKANGALAISYEFKVTDAKGSLSEAGLSVLVPTGFNEFRWIGQGPYAGYPGKDRLNEFGLFHLNREDLRFQGNRRETELAMLTDAKGDGLALAMAAGDMAVERQGDATLLSQNAVIGGLGNKGTRPESTIALSDGLHVAGSFTLLPVGAAWPAALVRWFGKPAAADNVFRPFYHSYDQ